MRTGSRIHFGVVNPFNRDMRLYISAGVGVERPSNRVLVSENSSGLVVRGCRAEEVRERIRPLEERYGRLYGEVEILECVPRHVGLGSTTQLLLAVARGLLEVNGVEADILETASLMGLGRISGVGTHVFIHGGFVVDSGRRSLENRGVPGLLIRTEFPEDWVFVVVVPRGSGLDDSREREVFSGGYRVERELVWRAGYTLFSELVPAVIERDFERFSEALYELQTTVGSMFSVFQGGVYSVYSQKAVEILRREGIVGVGQSSWGPTVYGVVRGYEKALEVSERLRPRIEGDVLVVKALNRGAEVIEY